MTPPHAKFLPANHTFRTSKRLAESALPANRDGMFRRLSVFLVVLACAFAPALPALAAVLPEAPACCCASNHCCGRPECPVPVAVRLDNSSAVNVALVSRAIFPRVAERLTRTLFIFVSPAFAVSAPLNRAPSALVAAGSVPLFTAHCSFLL